MILLVNVFDRVFDVVDLSANSSRVNIISFKKLIVTLTDKFVLSKAPHTIVVFVLSEHCKMV